MTPYLSAGLISSQTPIECQQSGHRFAPTGLWVDNRGMPELHFPCLRKDCNVERVLHQSWSQVVGPGLSINGIALDIEDDPDGGVAKIVCREAVRDYTDIELHGGDVVIDIGAHVGIVSIYLAKRFPGILIYAFEPCRVNFDRLCRNLDANGVGGISAHCQAVTGDGRVVQLNSDLSKNSGGGAIYGVGPNMENVDSITLPQIFEKFKIGSCALLKIDCEGAEYEILEAAPSLLSKVKRLRGEFHVNQRLRAQGQPQKLLDLCHARIGQENVRVSVCEVGEWQ